MSYIEAGSSGVIKGLIAGGLCVAAAFVTRGTAGAVLVTQGAGTYMGVRALVEASRNMAAESNGPPPSAEPTANNNQQIQQQKEHPPLSIGADAAAESSSALASA